MTYETDQRLKSRLDSNQLARERLCLAILKIDGRFVEVQPRAPRGGPDGGADIIARDKLGGHIVAAVGFKNEACDSAEQKRDIKRKFGSDLISAMSLADPLSGFIFFTNISFTVDEKSQLQNEALSKGIPVCDIFDRERMKGILDSAEGFAARFQYLGIPLSESEQLTFFSRWGDDIEQIVSGGFSRVESVLRRLHFLQESQKLIDSIRVVIELDREYAAAELSHIRMFCEIGCIEISGEFGSFIFGTTDNTDRGKAKLPSEIDEKQNGAKNGFSDHSWVWTMGCLPPNMLRMTDEPETRDEFIETISGYRAAPDSFDRLVISYDCDPFPIRMSPTTKLQALDGASVIFQGNRSFVEKISTISVAANEYLLARIPREQFRFSEGDRGCRYPVCFTEHELKDKWVRIRPANGCSTFDISFSRETPIRYYDAREVEH